MAIDWKKTIGALIGLWGLLGVLTHVSLLSVLMLAYGGYVFFTGDVKLVAPRAKIKEHLRKRDE